MNFIDRIGVFIESISYNFKHETDFEDSLFGSWYISPKAHGIEFLTVVPFYLIMTLYFANKAIFKNQKNYSLLSSSMKHRPSRSTLETVCLVAMVISYSITVSHKIITNTEYFLLQPCHVSAFMLIMIMSWPNETYQFIPQLLFNVYLHTLWGTILALIFPDLRDHDMFGEVFNFFLEHGLILILPFYLLTTKRYTVLPSSIPLTLFSFFLYVAYHSPFLHIISLLTGYNLNYTLVTPALGFLIMIGHWYRLAMYSAAFLFMFITRYILIGSFLKISNIKHKNE